MSAPRSPRASERAHEVRYRGKVARISFDRFGDFDGFWLETEDGPRRFRSRERRVERLIREAWEQRSTLVVVVEHHDPHTPTELALVRP